ncbi:MAG: hypothetical protein MZW92_72260 [Comamonadaceae bacterium]|nr:hypothetical protein [Comamonadaceae bacterium]
MYRVLEHIPVSALGKLYLSTAYGHTLGLSRSGIPTAGGAGPAHVPGSGAGQQPGGQHARSGRPTITASPASRPNSSVSPACASSNWGWARWRPIPSTGRWATCRTRSCTTCARPCWS